MFPSCLRLPFRVSAVLGRSLLSAVAIIAASVGPVLLRLPGLSHAPFLLLDLPCRLDFCLPRLFRICLPFLLPFSFPCFCASVGWDLLVLQRAPVPDLSRPCFVAIVLRRGLRLLFSPRVSVRRCGCPCCSGRLHPRRIARFGRACCVAVFVAAVVRVFLATAVCALQPPHRPCSP